MPAIRLSRCPELGHLAIEVDFVGSELLEKFACGKGLEPVCPDEFFQVISRVPAANHLAVLFSGVFVVHGSGLMLSVAAARYRGVGDNKSRLGQKVPA